MDVYHLVVDGNLDELRTINQDEVINWRDEHHWSLLHFACYYNRKDIVKYLIDYIDVNLLTLGGSTPLMLTRDIDIINILINNGADVNVNHHATALFYAVASDNYEISKLLLSNGADPNLADNDGNTPLHTVLDVDMLTVNVDMINFDMVELLLRYDADINLANNKGIKPIDVYPDVVNYLPIEIKEPDDCQ